MFDAGQISVGRLTVRDHGAPQTLRQRALRRVGNADPDLPLPPSEILIVRTLRDPIPGGLTDGQSSACWDRALAVELDWCRQHAVRPASAPVPADAVAVRFRDRAELLTCLLEDLVLGRGERWWWQSVLRHYGMASPDRVLLAEPLYLPAIAEALVARGTAAVLSNLSGDTCRSAMEALGADPGRVASALRNTQGADPVNPALRIHTADPGNEKILPARIREQAERSLAALARPAASLLSVSLVRRFHSYLPADTVADLSAHLVRQTQGTANAGPVTQDTPSTASGQPTALPKSGQPASPPGPGALQTGVADPRDEIPGETAMDESGSQTQGTAVRSAGQSHRGAETDAKAPAPGTDTLPTSPEEVTAQTREDLPAEGLATQLAGAFFLVNLLEPGGLSDATAAAAAPLIGPEHGPWSILGATARHLLGGDAQPDDDIWLLLEQLAGRSGDATPLNERMIESVANAVGDWFADAVAPLPRSIHRKPPEILRREGRVHAGAMHIDVEMRLETADPLTRMLGLDIDPGWCPLFGRIIGFDYRE